MGGIEVEVTISYQLGQFDKLSVLMEVSQHFFPLSLSPYIFGLIETIAAVFDL
jgi:hypothetical protein